MQTGLSETREQGEEHGGQLHEHGGQLDPDTPVDQEVYEVIFKASKRMMQDGESRDSETMP